MPAPIPEWRGNLRREIKVEHLMRMTTGLALDKPTAVSIRPARWSICMTTWPASRPMPPSCPSLDALAYSSPTTQLLARVVRDAVGGPEQTLAFAWRELLNPLGMRNVTLEFDGAGTLQGSTYMLASARDWGSSACSTS